MMKIKKIVKRLVIAVIIFFALILLGIFIGTVVGKYDEQTPLNKRTNVYHSVILSERVKFIPDNNKYNTIEESLFAFDEYTVENPHPAIFSSAAVSGERTMAFRKDTEEYVLVSLITQEQDEYSLRDPSTDATNLENYIFKKYKDNTYSYPIAAWATYVYHPFTLTSATPIGAREYTNEDLVAANVMTSYTKRHTVLVNDIEEKMFFGIHPNADIYNMTVRGQKPTEIIEINEKGNIYYFWHYSGEDKFSLFIELAEIDINKFSMLEAEKALDIKFT